MAAKTIVALRYMERFRCLGGECEDTCCAHWSVKVDQSHYVKLKRAMKGSADRELFERTFARCDPPTRTNEAFARITMDPETDHCPCLSGDKLCGLHQRFGEALLPDICSTYPRYLSQIGARIELSGKLSCPEAARGALLPADGLELVGVNAAVAGRTEVSQRPLPHDAPFVNEMRRAALELLDRAYPFSSSVYFVLVLWHAATPLIAGDTRDFPRLRTMIERFLRADSLDMLHTHLRAAPQPTMRACVAVLHQVARLRSAVRHQLGLEVDRIVDTYVAQGVLVRGDEAVQPSEGFPAAYAARRGVIAPELAERAEQVLLNWVKQFCLRELYPRRASPRAWALELVLRLATLRFLVFSDPGALRDRASLEQRIITIVYQSARSVEHSDDLLDGLMQGMADRLPNLEAAAELIFI